MGQHRRRRASRYELDETTVSEIRYERDQRYTWIVYAIATLVVGGLMGYILAIQGARSTVNVPAPNTTTSSAAPVIDEGALRAYRDILARDPKNVQAAISAANILYDAQWYAEAIPLYHQAFALNPSDINVSTDLGTALWYSGRPDEALAQYDKSLALNGAHAQTLFNIGIVKSEGKRDYAGAVASWEKLLATNPTSPDVVKVRGLIADAQKKAQASAPPPMRTGA